MAEREKDRENGKEDQVPADEHAGRPQPGDEADGAEEGDGQGESADAASDDRSSSEPTAAPPESRGSPAMGILLFIVFLGAGFFIGKWWIARDTAAEIQAEAGERVRVNLRGDEPKLGPDDALVTIVEFADYQCPYCARANGPVKEMVEKYKGDVRLIYKHYPLPGHPRATPAAKAAWAAHQQGKFWEMHDFLFANKADANRAIDHARELGLDVDKFTADMGSPEAAQAVDDDFKAGALVRLRGTPAFVVNGSVIGGAMTDEQWHRVIQAELSRTKSLIDAGTSRAEVYEKLMEGALDRRENPAAPAAAGEDKAGAGG